MRKTKIRRRESSGEQEMEFMESRERESKSRRERRSREGVFVGHHRLNHVGKSSHGRSHPKPLVGLALCDPGGPDR
ncbi:hypothetical protein NL676_009511 [Syzygium grande]|nr:hypothetical protein NL676_009511 [Syzygium grande]